MKENLTAIAQEQIYAYILHHDMSSGDKIPAERELCENLSLSRTTIRSAIKQLTAEGKLLTRHGSGTYVAPSKYVRCLTGVNTLSEDFRKSDMHFSTQIVSFHKLSANEQLADKLAISLTDDVYELIRLRELDDEPFFIETLYLDSQLVPNIINHYNENTSIYRLYKQVYNLEPVSGEEKINVTYASEEEADWLHLKPNSPLFYATGITTLANGKVLEYYKMVFRPDKFTFVCDGSFSEDFKYEKCN